MPWFRALAAQPGLALKVYYALLPDATQQGAGFGVAFQWDLPLLEGYGWTALPNARRRPSTAGFFASSTPTVADALTRDAPDAVLISGWNALPLLQALRACLLLRIPRMVRGDSNTLKPRNAIQRAMHRALLSRFDACLAVGRANRDFYLRNCVPPERIFDCPHFVDNDRFADEARRLAPGRVALRARWAIPEGAFCYLFAGKLQPKKRVLDVLAALGRMRHDAGERHLLVAGAGEQMEQARSVVRASGVPATFAGFLNQTEMPLAYAAADCVVLPSDYGETWGLVVNEAMASGLPAIVSDRVGCGPDLIVEGVTGSMFRFGHVEALAACMRALEQRPREAVREMGRSAAKRVESYSVARAVAGVTEAARSIARGKR